MTETVAWLARGLPAVDLVLVHVTWFSRTHTDIIPAVDVREFWFLLHLEFLKQYYVLIDLVIALAVKHLFAVCLKKQITMVKSVNPCLPSDYLSFFNCDVHTVNIVSAG